MNVVRIREPDKLTPLHVTMLCLIGLTVAGGSLLLSAAEPTRPVDGAIPWHEQSPLRALVQVLCLNYEWPTTNAGAVKIYILGLGSGLAMTALGIALLVRGRAGEEESTSDEPLGTTESSGLPGDDARGAPVKHHLAPVLAAQLLVLLFLLWSFASSRWSAAPDLAVGGSLLLVIHFLWAFALGNGLSAAAARLATRIIVAVTALTALVAIWYYYGRNPELRAKFPFGNPQFLAACLIPGILISVALLMQHATVRRENQPPGAKTVALVALAVVTLVTALWAFRLADTRGAAAGLAFGFIVMLFLTLRGKWKIAPVLLTVGLAVAGWSQFTNQANAFSPTGRSATLRFRTYSWSYAWRMFRERPLTGHGQGAFVLKGDGYAFNDIPNDPEVFTHRIAHAHNEWLETLSDLGSVGLVLLVAAVCFTFAAGFATLRTNINAATRWCLIGLMSSLAALLVEESFGVGLRVSGVPTIYYTLIGLIWVFGAGSGDGQTLRPLSRARGRVPVGIGALLFGLASLVLSQQDWSAARHGFEADAALADGKIDEAIAHATRATTRLNPQRALTNMYRLAEARLRAALMLQQSAADREQRALSSEPVNFRVATFAGEDYAASDEQCVEAAHALKELVQRSPDFLNHGHLDYLINLTRATNTEASVRLRAALSGGSLGEEVIAAATRKRDQFLKNATAAIERELRRQPFDPLIAVSYAAAIQDSADLSTIFGVLTRPLRYHRIGTEYVRFLMALSSRADFDQELSAVVDEVVRTLSAATQDAEGTPKKDLWAPERLRLAATIWFLRGDYSKARGGLEVSVGAYDAIAPPPLLATASAWAELADCRFFDDPLQPDPAIEAAQRALAAAPPSEPGRTLSGSIRHRLIQYLLAAENEPGAIDLLRLEAPPNTPESAIGAELGARYRRLCETLLARRESQLLRKPVDQLFPKMLAWNQRALELNPEDPLTHRLAADMAFHGGAYDDAARYLESATTRGLPLSDALQFLSIARQQKPDSEALNALWNAWTKPPDGSGRPPTADDAAPSDVLAPDHAPTAP